MKLKRFSYSVSLGLLIAFLSLNRAEAWTHEISVGFGWGQEIGANYENNAMVLNGTFYKFNKIDNTLFATLDGTLAQLMSATPTHNTVVTAAISLGFRAYFQNPDFHKIRPYLGISFGPAYLSQTQLGTQRQGAHYDFQSTLGGGIEFAASQTQNLDVSLHLIHYCNAGLARPNEGFDIPFLLSIGYQF